jgi:hypothetical protein
VRREVLSIQFFSIAREKIVVFVTRFPWPTSGKKFDARRDRGDLVMNAPGKGIFDQQLQFFSGH